MEKLNIEILRENNKLTQKITLIICITLIGILSLIGCFFSTEGYKILGISIAIGIILGFLILPYK